MFTIRHINTSLSFVRTLFLNNSPSSVPRETDAEKKERELAQIEATTQKEVAVLRGEVGLTAQSEALQKLMKSADPNTKEIIASLKDANISSLLVLTRRNPEAIKGFLSTLGFDKSTENNNGRYSWGNTAINKFREELSYSADGGFYFDESEQQAVARFLTAYTENEIFRKQIDAISPYAEAGLDTTVALRDAKNVDKLRSPESVAEYFGDVPSGRYTKDQVTKTLLALAKDPKFPSYIGNMIPILAPENLTLEGLINIVKKDPTHKAKFFDAINANAANGVVGLTSFLKGNGAEKAEAIPKMLQEKAAAAITDLRATIDNQATPPDQRKKAQAELDTLNNKGGASWLTGEFQKVAQGAFLNIGKNANMAGFGVTYEAFVKGLTLSIGAGVAEGKFSPVAVVHYDALSGKIGETAKSTVRGNVGIGSSLFPVAIPFIDGGVSVTDKITTLGNGRGGVDSIGVNAQLMKYGGVVSVVSLNERADEIAQGQAKLLGAVDMMKDIAGTSVTDKQISEILQKAGLKSTPAYTHYWALQMNELYSRNGVNDTTPPGAKGVLLMGLVNSEVEKAQVEEAQNDRDAKSFKGFSVGIGHLFGVTFPVAGLYWKEGKMTYAPSKTESTPVAGAPRALPTKTETLKFEDLFEKSADGNTITFKKGEAPQSISIDPALGTYDEKTGILTLVDPSKVVYTKFDKLNEKLISVTVRPSEQKQDEVKTVRAKSDSIAGYAGVIYTLNRTPAYKSFNKALLEIADGQYDVALKTLQDFSVKDKRIADILKKLDAVNHPENLRAINTYTYGAEKIKNATSVDKVAYAEARKGTSTAEQRGEWGARWNTSNEAQFSNYESHTPTELSRLIPNELSVTVFATPKGAAHRIDKFNDSITVSNNIVKQVSEAQKDALIKDHAKQIRDQISRLQEFVKSGGKDASKITESAYIDMLKTGTISTDWKDLGLDFAKKPVFFEARAMAAGNICMNKVDGIGYPSFEYKNAGGTLEIQRTTPPTQIDGEMIDEKAGTAAFSEEVTVLGASGFSQKREDVGTQGEKNDVITEPEVTPGPKLGGEPVVSTPGATGGGAAGPGVAPPAASPGTGIGVGGGLVGAPSVGPVAPPPPGAAPIASPTPVPAPVNGTPVPPPPGARPPDALNGATVIKLPHLVSGLADVASGQLDNAR